MKELEPLDPAGLQFTFYLKLLKPTHFKPIWVESSIITNLIIFLWELGVKTQRPMSIYISLY